jgi:hypothetical protein
VFHAGNATVIGSTGVTLLLVAFFLNLIKMVRSDSWLYLVMNLVGGSLACYSSYLIRFMPFVILEGTWAAVAMVGIARKSRLLRQAG